MFNLEHPSPLIRALHLAGTVQHHAFPVRPRRHDAPAHIPAYNLNLVPGHPRYRYADRQRRVRLGQHVDVKGVHRCGETDIRIPRVFGRNEPVRRIKDGLGVVADPSAGGRAGGAAQRRGSCRWAAGRCRAENCRSSTRCPSATSRLSTRSCSSRPALRGCSRRRRGLDGGLGG